MEGDLLKRNENKLLTFENKFARKYYCNSNRFTRKIKRANNKKFRRLSKFLCK